MMNEYLGLGIVFLAFEYAYFILAKRLRIVDRPHYQSSHTGVVVRGGGFLFYAAYALWFIVSGFQYPMIFAGLSIIAVTSFADDVHSISPKVRMVLQFLAMMVMLYETHVFNLPSLRNVLLLSIACVGAVNIYNFMDGVNGMTGGYSLVVITALIYVNKNVETFIDDQLLRNILLAVIVFCLFNFRKHAKCFAGDVGSLSIGFILIFLILKLVFKTSHIYWIAFIIAYLVDGGLTILHRIMLKENILKPHKKHAYQIMANELKMPHLAVSGFYMVIQGLCCAWFIAVPSNLTLFAQTTLLIIMYLLFMKKYYHLHVRKEEGHS